MASVAVLVVLYLLFSRVYADPNNVFWGMVNNNLATHGITKEVTQEGTDGTQTEYTQLSLNPSPSIRSVKTLSYTEQSGAITNLTLEAIITPENEYQHYAKIDRPSPSGAPDYNKIYGMWLKNEQVEGQRPAAFDNGVYGALLFGNLERAQRTEIINLLEKAYKVNISKSGKKISDGRRTYTYELKVNMRQYAAAAAAYSRLHGLSSSINPENYRPSDEISLKLSVDVLSRQVREIEYQGGVTEKYRGYGTPAKIIAPTKTVSPEQLQKALETIGG